MTDKFKQYRLDNGELYAWICLDEKEFEQSVPKQFPKSEGRTWRIYSTLISLPNGLTFILVGEHDQNGNREKCVTDDEFAIWQDHFAGRNIWCYAEAIEYMKQFQGADDEIL